MKSFALLLNHAPDRYEGLSEADYMDVIKDYVAWVEDMTERGVYKGGHKLMDEAGKTLTRINGNTEVHDSPFAELAEVLGGLMIIEAESYDAALEIAKGHPHMKHNISMDIREIHDV